MKRILLILFLVLLLLTVLFFLIHSTYSFNPKDDINAETAVKIAQKALDDKTIKTITNIDNPKIEEVIFNEKPSIYLFNVKTDATGIPLYKITFNTTQDGLLGPVVFYINKSGGEIIGMGYRE